MSKMYMFTYQASDCSFTVECNGFPVIDCNDGGSGGGPLNLYMLGKGNELRIKFSRKGPDASFSAGIQEAQKGDMMDTSTGGDLSLPEGDEIVHVFDGEADDLKQLLDEASTSDADTMLKFAMDYCAAVREGDMDALKKFNRYRLEQASKDFGVPLDQLAPQMLEMFKSFKDGAHVGVDDVEVRMLNSDKVWEVRRKDGRALIYIEEEDGSTSAGFVAAVLEDGPQVVR